MAYQVAELMPSRSCGCATGAKMLMTQAFTAALRRRAASIVQPETANAALTPMSHQRLGRKRSIPRAKSAEPTWKRLRA